MAHNDYVGQIIDGKYKVVRFVGRGGIGAVYFARHVVSDTPAAIKFLHSQFAEKAEILETFYREAQTASAIGHSSIVSIFDAGMSEAGEPYVAMEYLDGESLASFLSRSGPVSLEVTCAVIESVLLALEAAHTRGIVHRFLKPENIFIVNQDQGPPLIKIVDFGISKLTNPDQIDLTRYGVKLGTPTYMAPEQIKGGANIDLKADLYSVGVLMYKMLTGKIPFKGNQYHEILIASTSYPPLPPIEANSSFPLEAEALIMRCLEKSPQNRPEDAREILHCIKAFSGYERRNESLRAAITNLTMGTVIGKGSTVIGDLSSDLLIATSAAAAEAKGSSSNTPLSNRRKVPVVTATPPRRRNASRSSANRSKPSPSSMSSRTPAPVPQSMLQRLTAISFWKQKKVIALSAAVVSAVILLVVVFAVALSHGSATEEVRDVAQSENLSSDASALNGNQPQHNAQNEGADSGNIQIEVRGLPRDAKILYDGIPVPFNPFKVSARESIVPMRVEAPGYQPFVTSVVPSEDQVVVVSMDRLGAAPAIPTNEYVEEQPIKDDDLGIQAPPAQIRSKPLPVAKPHRSKPQKKVAPATNKKNKGNEDTLQKNRNLIDMSDIYD